MSKIIEMPNSKGEIKKYKMTIDYVVHPITNKLVERKTYKEIKE